jgi:WD40 repeat protein
MPARNQDTINSLQHSRVEEKLERGMQASSIDIIHGCVNTRPSTVRRCISDDIVLLLLCSSTRVIVVSEQDMVLMQVLSGHTSDVVAVAFGPPPSHSKTIVSADSGRVIIWSLRDSTGTGETADVISGKWMPWVSFKWNSIESIVCPPFGFSILFTDTDALHEVVFPQQLPPGDPLNWELRPSVDPVVLKKRASLSAANVDDQPEDRGLAHVILSGAFDFLTVSPDGNVVALRNRPTPNGISGSLMVVGLKRFSGAQPAIAHHDGLSVTSYDWNRSPVYASSPINLLLSSTESGDVFVWLVEQGTQRSMNPKDLRLRPVISVTCIAVLEVHCGLPCFGLWLLDEKEAHNTLSHYQNLSPGSEVMLPDRDSELDTVQDVSVNVLPPADDPIMNQWIVCVCSNGEVALVQLCGINHKHLLQGDAQLQTSVVARGSLGQFASPRPRLFCSSQLSARDLPRTEELALPFCILMSGISIPIAER